MQQQDTSQAVLPTEAQLEAAIQTLHESVDAFCRVQWQAGKVAQGEGVGQTPTFSDIGRLFVFADDATGRLDEIRDYVDKVSERLSWLNVVREGFDPDGRRGSSFGRR